MTPEPFYKSGAFQNNLVISLALNGVGLMFACSVLGFGFLGVGLSSSTPEDLRQIWYSFVWLAFCCPATLNTGLLAYTAFEARRKQDTRVWQGWLAGLGLMFIPFLCLALFSAAMGGF
jgi:hypothetical protein